jgi:hypothetical protein
LSSDDEIPAPQELSIGVTTEYLTFVTQTRKLAQQIHHEPAPIPLRPTPKFFRFDFYVYFDLDNFLTLAARQKIFALNSLR